MLCFVSWLYTETKKKQPRMRNKMKWFLPKMYMVLVTLSAVAVLNLFFSAGAFAGQATFEPQTTAVIEPRVETRLVERHTVQYVDRPVTVVEYIERVKSVPVKLRNFSNLEELKQWLVAVDTYTTTIYFQSPDVTVDCDDYALEMQRKALADGHIMSFGIIGRSEYNALFQSELPPGQSLHAINLAIIGNSAYYIEPQTNEVVFVTYLD